MNESLQKRRRLINWWMTWKDLNWPSEDVLEDIKRRAEAAARANVTTAITSARSAKHTWSIKGVFL